jgi:hypothetical protein
MIWRLTAFGVTPEALNDRRLRFEENCTQITRIHDRRVIAIRSEASDDHWHVFDWRGQAISRPPIRISDLLKTIDQEGLASTTMRVLDDAG